MSNQSTALTLGLTAKPQRKAASIVATMFAVWKQRRALAGMPPERLEDLGISRQEAQIESARRLWDVPDHWLMK